VAISASRRGQGRQLDPWLRPSWPLRRHIMCARDGPKPWP